MARRVIIDTDPGVDDALALLLALRSPELRVEAITSVAGNVPVDVATQNVQRVLALAESPEWPVLAHGAPQPLEREPVFATFLHGHDGLGGAAHACEGQRLKQGRELSHRTAAEEILHQLALAEEPVTVIALGPLTNIALALERDEGQLARLERLVVMGGAVEAPGNVTPAAEFNFFFDPEAAARVLQSGLPLTLVGLDVTAKAVLPEQELRREVASRPSRVGRFVVECTSAVYASMLEREGTRSMPLHDPLAVALVLEPSLVQMRYLHVSVETRGELTRGLSLADRRPLQPQLKEPPNASVCLQVDVPRFMKLFTERVLWPQSSSSAAPTRI